VIDSAGKAKADGAAMPNKTMALLSNILFDVLSGDAPVWTNEKKAEQGNGYLFVARETLNGSCFKMP
jgi:hypothetical protein